MQISLDSGWLGNWRCDANNVRVNHLFHQSFFSFCSFSVTISNADERFSLTNYRHVVVVLFFFSSVAFDVRKVKDVLLCFLFSFTVIFSFCHLGMNTSVFYLFIFSLILWLVSPSFFNSHSRAFTSHVTDRSIPTTVYAFQTTTIIILALVLNKPLWKCATDQTYCWECGECFFVVVPCAIVYSQESALISEGISK